MKRFALFGLTFALVLAGMSVAQPSPREKAEAEAIVARSTGLAVEQVRIPEKQAKKKPRGAKPTPGHKIASAAQYKVTAKAPLQTAYVPPKLDMWGNDVDGDCVTAEEAFAKACAIAGQTPGTFIPSATVVAWAQKRGYLNGAYLTDVMDSMKGDGFVIGTQRYDDGGYASVDYSNETILQSAIAVGPVKIGIDANALPDNAGDIQGWYATGGTPGQFPNEDHCPSLCGFGTAQYLFGQLGVALPSGLKPTQTGYLVFTWSTIGFVDHPWLMSCCGEAWVRNPTTVGVPPLNPAPPVPPTPPSPPVPTPGTLTLPATITLNGDGTWTLGGGTGLLVTPQTTLQQIIDAMQKQKAK